MSIDPHLQKKLDAFAEKAIEIWGGDAQMSMMIEEALEVALEMHRRIRGRHDNQKMLEESVDCYIMAVEMGYLFGWDKFNDMLKKKLDRFGHRLYQASGDNTYLWKYDNDQEDQTTDKSDQDS